MGTPHLIFFSLLRVAWDGFSNRGAQHWEKEVMLNLPRLQTNRANSEQSVVASLRDKASLFMKRAEASPSASASLSLSGLWAPPLVSQPPGRFGVGLDSTGSGARAALWHFTPVLGEDRRDKN